MTHVEWNSNIRILFSPRVPLPHVIFDCDWQQHKWAIRSLPEYQTTCQTLRLYTKSSNQIQTKPKSSRFTHNYHFSGWMEMCPIDPIVIRLVSPPTQKSLEKSIGMSNVTGDQRICILLRSGVPNPNVDFDYQMPIKWMRSSRALEIKIVAENDALVCQQSNANPNTLKSILVQSQSWIFWSRSFIYRNDKLGALHFDSSHHQPRTIQYHHE